MPETLTGRKTPTNGAELQAWMDFHGYSKQSLATALGVDRSTVYHWGWGDRPILLVTQLALEGLLARARARKTRSRASRRAHRERGDA